MLCGQSKLKSVVANLALQPVKTVEAATIKEFNNCNLELIQLLIMLNLILTILLVLGKLKKSSVSRTFIYKHGKDKIIPGKHSILCAIRVK